MTDAVKPLSAAELDAMESERRHRVDTGNYVALLPDEWKRLLATARASIEDRDASARLTLAMGVLRSLRHENWFQDHAGQATLDTMDYLEGERTQCSGRRNASGGE